MRRRAGGRRETLHHGVKKYKIRCKNFLEEGISTLLEQFIPQRFLQKLFNFAEEWFKVYTKINCELCLIPYSLSEDGKLEPVSRTKIWIHYLVLSVLVVSMMHKLIIFLILLSSKTLNTSTFICCATFLCYLVAFSISSSCLFLTDETMDMINGWPKILMYFAEEDGKSMRLVTNTKTAVVISSLAVLAMATACPASTFSIAFQALPVTFLVMAESVGVIPVTWKVPRVIWKLLLWQE